MKNLQSKWSFSYIYWSSIILYNTINTISRKGSCLLQTNRTRLWVFQTETIWRNVIDKSRSTFLKREGRQVFFFQRKQSLEKIHQRSNNNRKKLIKDIESVTSEKKYSTRNSESKRKKMIVIDSKNILLKLKTTTES